MYSPNQIKHKITNLQLVMQLKPEKKHLPLEEDYNPKNRIFKFNIYTAIYIYMTIRLWWLSCPSNGRFPPLRGWALYQRSDHTTKEFVNTLRKISYLSQYFSRQISAVTFLNLGIWQWLNMAQISYNETVSFHMSDFRVEWSCWTEQTYSISVVTVL